LRTAAMLTPKSFNQFEESGYPTPLVYLYGRLKHVLSLD